MPQEQKQDVEAVKATETEATATETGARPSAGMRLTDEEAAAVGEIAGSKGGDDSAAAEIRRTLKVITTQLATIEDRLSSIDTWRKKTGW